MRGPGNTNYYKLCLDSLGAPRIACTRLEAAGRKIAQQFFVQHEIDKAVLSSQAGISSHGNQSTVKLDLPTEKRDLQYLQNVIPYAGQNIQELSYSAESHPLQNATSQDIKRMLSGSGRITKVIAETANRSHFWASDWVKIISKLLSTQKIAHCQSITESLIATGEKLPLGILTAVLNIARIKGDGRAFEFYASCCPIPRIPIPYPPTQLQLVVSNVRYHRAPRFLRNSSTHIQFFSGNWRQDPDFPELLVALSKGYLKYKNPEMLDTVMWWAHETNNLTSRIAYINLAAARQWHDSERAWWTWQQVKAGKLENSYLNDAARGFKCLENQIQSNAHTPKLMLIEAVPCG